MPTYEYRCEGCGNEFSKVMSMGEHGQKEVRCPSCGGANVFQKFSTFYARTSRKS
jgi:putative FmdB family regulatory protein